MFLPEPSPLEKLKIVFNRYKMPLMPYNHFKAVNITFPLYPGVKKGTKNAIVYNNGQIDFDYLTDGQNMTYEVSYEQDGQTYKSHVKARLLTEEEKEEKRKIYKGKVPPSYIEGHIEDTLVVTSIILDNQQQDIKSPQEIDALVNYMGNIFTRESGKILIHREDKSQITGKSRKFLDRAAFKIKRGM